MTTRINLQPVPNQSLTITLDNVLYNLTIKEAGGAMAFDLSRDNQIVLQGARITAGTPLISYQYQVENGGNFILTTTDNQAPFYTKFNESQFLIYASPEELAEFSQIPPEAEMAINFNRYVNIISGRTPAPSSETGEIRRFGFPCPANR